MLPALTRWLIVGLLCLRPAVAGATLDSLYQRIASDIKGGKPLVITVHVALCDNGVIWCGLGGHGNGDEPRRNLYWGGAGGLRAYFDRAPGYKRVMLDRGDGKVVIERAVYRRRVLRPSAAWRRLGVTEPFDVLLVGLGYRGREIARASDAMIRQTLRAEGERLRLPDGTRLAIGGHGHVVGYAGHNHLMDDPAYAFPQPRRRTDLGFFALSCLSAPYLASHLTSAQSHALVLTLSLMYPGAFTIDGLIQGLAEAAPQAAVFDRAVQLYAKYQRRELRRVRGAFTHDGEPRFRRRFLPTRRAKQAAASGETAPRPPAARAPVPAP
jgi:hypothetical protein